MAIGARGEVRKVCPFIEAISEVPRIIAGMPAHSQLQDALCD
jgi:hypothetical protein